MGCLGLRIQGSRAKGLRVKGSRVEGLPFKVWTLNPLKEYQNSEVR